jgi:pimeloyl-ACP methyl ester carboxylesterase
MPTTLIIIPGWGGSHETWSDFVTLAKPHFNNVIVIDLPCFGDEPCPSKVWGVEEYSNFVESKISKYKNKQMVLLGHSFGGAVAAHLVKSNPKLIDKLVLSGAAIYRPKNYLKRTALGFFAKIAKLIISIIPSKKLRNTTKRLTHKLTGTSDYNETTGIKRQIFKKIVRQDQGHILSNIVTPTCVIQGTNDTYVPYRFGKRIAEHIPSASFVTIADGRHGLHISSKKIFLNTILEFIEKII